MILSSSFMLQWLRFLIINIICSFPSLSSPSTFGSWFWGWGWGFLNQQFLKVKPQEKKQAQPGKGKKGGCYCCLLVYSDFSLTTALSVCVHFPCVWYTTTIRSDGDYSFGSSIHSLSACQCFPHRQEPFHFHKRVRSPRKCTRHLNQQYLLK